MKAIFDYMIRDYCMCFHDLEGKPVYQWIGNTVGLREMPDGKVRIDRYEADSITVRETMREIISHRVAVKADGQYWAEPEDIRAVEYKNGHTLITFSRRYKDGGSNTVSKDWPFFDFLMQNVCAERLCDKIPEEEGTAKQL